MGHGILLISDESIGMAIEKTWVLYQGRKLYKCPCGKLHAERKTVRVHKKKFHADGAGDLPSGELTGANDHLKPHEDNDISALGGEPVGEPPNPAADKFFPYRHGDSDCATREELDSRIDDLEEIDNEWLAARLEREEQDELIKKLQEEIKELKSRPAGPAEPLYSCSVCDYQFYDLKQRPKACPKCGAELE